MIYAIYSNNAKYNTSPIEIVLLKILDTSKKLISYVKNVGLLYIC